MNAIHGAVKRNSVFLVAEMSANHNGSRERAEQIIRAAADSGADAVKMQTYTPDTLTLDCDRPYFKIKGTIWEGRTLHDLYSEAQTPWEWFPGLMALANDLGLDCFSTPFDSTAVDFLESCGVSRYKIASFELVDLPLLKKVASTGKPVILSTGMAALGEIDEAVRVLRDNGAGELTLLKCTSAYPAPVEEANLRTIPHLAQTFSCKAGLSDHTMRNEVAIAAVALGASMVEKHFTVSRLDAGPDSSFSLEPAEFKNMAAAIRNVEKALGNINYDLTQKEKESIVFRRSLFIAEDVRAGERFIPRNLRCVRPGHGLHPRYYEEVMGKTATRDLSRGEPLRFGDWK